MNTIINHTLHPITNDSCHIKLKTTKDVQSIEIIYGDPHDYKKESETLYTWNAHKENLLLYQISEYNHYFDIIIKNKNKRFKYYFKINNEYFYGQKGYFGDDSNLDLYSTFYFPYVHDHEVFTPNPWVKDQVWCQIFVDRFYNGDSSNDPENTLAWQHEPFTNKSFFGGDLRGIILKLDDLVNQGFTGLYLTPIFLSPSNHKYDTIDYFEIDPHFGTKEDLQELVDECHARNMKIILDAVFNHSGYFFKPFQDVIEHKENSIYKDWFHITNFEPLEYETFSIVKTMPKLNTHNPEVANYLIKVLKYYLEVFNIDGWRFDVANELDHTFISKLSTKIKKDYPEAYLLAEIWHDANDFVTYNQFDGVMEYESSAVFIDYLNQNINVDDTIQRLSDINFRIPLNASFDQFHLIDSHDTARLMTMVNEDEDLALMALTHLSLLRGSICLFYGTHFLLAGENDPYCRVCLPHYPTQQQLTYQDKINQIINFRKEHLDLINTQQPSIEKDDNKLIYNFSKLKVIFDINNKAIELQ